MINLAKVLLIVLEVIGSCSVSSWREDAGVEEAVGRSEIFSMLDEVLYQVTLIHSFYWNNLCTHLPQYSHNSQLYGLLLRTGLFQSLP